MARSRLLKLPMKLCTARGSTWNSKWIWCPPEPQCWVMVLTWDEVLRYQSPRWTIYIFMHIQTLSPGRFSHEMTDLQENWTSSPLLQCKGMELWSEKGFLMGGQDWFICRPILSFFHLGILSIASNCKRGESNYPAWYSQSTVSLLANLHSANRNRVWETSLNSSKQLQIQYSYPLFVQIIKWSITFIKIWDQKATRLMIA